MKCSNSLANPDISGEAVILFVPARGPGGGALNAHTRPFVANRSSFLHVDLAFRVPDHAFEFQFQPVARPPLIPQAAITQAPLPVAKDLFNAAEDGAQGSVQQLVRCAQALSPRRARRKNMPFMRCRLSAATR